MPFNVYARVATDEVFAILEGFFSDSELFKVWIYRVANFNPSKDFEYSVDDFFKFDIFIYEGLAFDDRVIEFLDQVSFARKTALLLVNVSYSQALDRIASMEYHGKNLVIEEINSNEEKWIEHAIAKLIVRLKKKGFQKQKLSIKLQEI